MLKMRGGMALLVLLFSTCGALALSTQTEDLPESQNIGVAAAAAAAAADVSTQLDVTAELKELRDMVVELRVTLKYTQDEMKVMGAENVEVKERLVVSETKVEVLEIAKDKMKTEVEILKKENAIVNANVEALRTENAIQNQELATLKTRLAGSETEVDDLKVENAAQEAELTALQNGLAALHNGLVATVTDLENLEKIIQTAPKVAFSAGLGDRGYIESGKNDLNLVFSKIITNVGQAYSSGSGFFTAPVRGVYYFRFTVTDILSSRVMSIRMCKNGQQLMQLFEKDTDGYATYLSSGVTLELEVGDEVNMVLPAAYTIYDSINNHSIFSGFLLFPL